MNPQPSPVLFQEERAGEGRRLDCRKYNFCLTKVDNHNKRKYVEKWPSFHCGACDDFEPQTREELRRDLEGMAAMFRELYKIGRREVIGTRVRIRVFED